MELIMIVTEHDIYKNSRLCLKNIIEQKEQEIQDIQDEIFSIKQTMKVLDQEYFNTNIGYKQ